MISEDDKELLAQLAMGDPSSLKTIFDRYHRRLCSLSFQMLRNEDQAKDVVQEVFIKLWNGRERSSITISLEAYLKRAVINTSLNAIEKGHRSMFVSLPDVADTHPAFMVQSGDQSELQRKIDEAIQSLPTRTRAVFVLVRFEDMSYQQVSESLNISNKAVEKEMMKALKLLRDQLRTYLSLSVISALAFMLN